MTTTRRRAISFAALFDAAARYAGATLRWRGRMGLEVTHRELDALEVAEGARELSWRHPEARGGRS